jgi:iron complex transport system substrate-binding protein
MGLSAFCARMAMAVCVVSATADLTLAQGQPIQVADDRGVTVTLPQPAARVAAVSTIAADFLVAVHRKPVALARTGDKILPKLLGDSIEELPDLGSRAAPNLERLASLRPDLIVAIRRYTEANAKKFEEIAPYLAFDVATYEDSLKSLTALGKATGFVKEAEALNESFVRLVQELGAKAPGGVSAALLWGDGTSPWVYYDNYLTADLMGKLKITNVIGPTPTPLNKTRFADQASLEDLLLKDPDIIFAFLPQDISMETNPVWRRLKAVRNGRAYAVGVQWMEVHGPIAREMVLREMAYLAYPNVFPKTELPDGVSAIALPVPK